VIWIFGCLDFGSLLGNSLPLFFKDESKKKLQGQAFRFNLFIGEKPPKSISTSILFAKFVAIN
jgi:hypothetical protein